MARLYLVRHGKAAAGWGGDPDPSLDDLGRAQAAAVAERLGPLGPLPILVSPLRRTRETAAPLEARWGSVARIDQAIAEVPSPSQELARRVEWLRGLLAGNWSEAVYELKLWRLAVHRRLLRVEEDSVVVSHFVAINAAVGIATDDDRVLCCRPDNGSITVLDARDDRLHLVELGAQADTDIR